MKTPLESFAEFFKHRMEESPDSHFSALQLQNPVFEKGRAELEIPYNEMFVGNPDTRIMANGVMSALLDTCCAIAAATSLEKIAFCPTLDLRMDHMGMAAPDKSLRAEAQVYRSTPSVIFTRGIIFQDEYRDRPIVRALINFTPIQHTILDTSVQNMDEAHKNPELRQ
ncbi:MAG: PaaI family thioesterase [Cellvibrionaceae bacterium]